MLVRADDMSDTRLAGHRGPTCCCVCVLQVESLLEQLDQKFDDMSTQILDRSMSPVFRASLRAILGSYLSQ